MRFLTLAALVAAAASVLAAEVKVDVTRAVECDRKSQKGDKISVHYKGTLQADGSEFDQSYKRGSPLDFVVGKGSVIKGLVPSYIPLPKFMKAGGWDDNLIGMCIGEKRTLTIPPEFGYGDRAMGPIPAGSTLIFETELMGIAGVPKPESIVEKTASSVASEATEAASEAKEGVKDTITSKLAEAAEAVKVVLADSDGDGQEHNEL
ncbi:hypothetical protein EG329_002002 [Mollisiaceae sp. DMI_Dod_QoI]|nr:hypothetical protein EG329_002002 [Helotiales sp. DMI_Dod_QoI]